MTAVTGSESFDSLALRPIDDLVRIGRGWDGGYLLPSRVFSRISVVVGLGIDVDWSFEADASTRCPSAKIVAVDATSGPCRFLVRGARAISIALRTRSARQLTRAVRSCVELSILSVQFARFFGAKHHHFVKRLIGAGGESDRMSWAQLCEHCGIDRDMETLLKIDIEGSEYGVVEDIARSSQAIVAIAIEFHELHSEFERFMRAHSILSQKFSLVHAHCNNWTSWSDLHRCTNAVELTYLRHDMLTATEISTVVRGRYYNQTFDAPCNPNATEAILHFSPDTPDQ